MKERQDEHIGTDYEFRKALFMWQVNPDSPLAAANLNELFSKVCKMKDGLSFKIKKEILLTSESQRAISPQDIKRYAKIEDNFFVFNLAPKKGPVGKLRINVRDLLNGIEDRGIIDRYNFVFEERTENGFRVIGIFRPHEIDSFKVKKYAK